MTFRRTLGSVLAVGLVVGLLLWPAMALAEPAAQAVCSGNVLLNPSFEDGFSDRGSGEVSVANGWNPWYQDGPGQSDGFNRRPQYNPESSALYGMRRIHSGNFAQKLFSTYATHNAGLFQQVQVTSGSKLTLSAWVQAWTSQQPDPGTVVEPGNYHVMIGIDPTGGTDWASANVVWSESHMEYNTWINLQLQSVAQAGTITVYLRGSCEFRTHFNDSYWDDACLTVVKPTPRATSTPKATRTPTPSPTPEPSPTPAASPTPTLVPTPLPGGVCVYVFEDVNGNGRRDEGEKALAGAAVTLLDGERVELSKLTSTDTGEPLCFPSLVAGTYYLNRQCPEDYTSTVPNDWGIAVVAGADTTVDLGCKVIPGPTATATPTMTAVPTVTPTPRPILRAAGKALYQSSGILLAALAVLILVGFLYLRKHL